MLLIWSTLLTCSYKHLKEFENYANMWPSLWYCSLSLSLSLSLFLNASQFMSLWRCSG
jgi:hypothetical protein